MRFKNLAFHIFLMWGIVFLTGCNGSGGSGNSEDVKDTVSKPTWTVMVHFAVDNGIDKDWEESTDLSVHTINNYINTLKNIKKKDTNNSIEIFLMLDSAESTGNYKDGYYTISADGSIEDDLAEQKEEINSGNVSEVEDFVDWVFEKRKGKRLFYSIYNHGSGFDDWNKEGVYGKSLKQSTGIGFDDSHDDSLSHNELGEITSYIKKKNGEKIDIFFTLACLMGGVELAQEVNGNVDYLLTSEDLFPVSDWSYEPLEEIIKDVNISGKNLGTKFCDSAFEHLSSIDSAAGSFTLSLIDPVKSTALREAIDLYAEDALSYIGDSVEKAKIFSDAAQIYTMGNLPGSGYNEYFYMTDIGSYMEAVKNTGGVTDGLKNRADEVTAALNDCVVYMRQYRHSKASGLTMYHHIWYSPYLYEPDMYCDVLDLGPNNAWAAYMEKIINLMPVKTDDFEGQSGNDHFDNANLIEFGLPQTHTISTVIDVDIMKIYLSTGESIRVRTSPGINDDDDDFSLSLDIYTYDESTEKAALQKSDVSLEDGYYPDCYFIAPEDGNFYLKFASIGYFVGDYRVLVSKVSGDSYEDDGSFETASTLKPGDALQEHTFHTPEDRDYVKLDLSEVNVNSFITIETTKLTTDTDTYAVLFDGEKTKIKANDDGGSNLFTKITFTCETPGIYYLYLYETGSDATGDYKLSIKAEGGTPPPPPIGADAFEPDNDMANAQTVDIAAGITKEAHTLNNSEDIDYFKVVLSKDQKIRIATFKNTIDTDTIIQITSSTGNQVAHNADGGEGSYSLLEWAAPSAGTWYIRIKTHPDDATGDYLIDIKDISPKPLAADSYEDDNSPASAKEILVGSSQNRSIFDAYDTDWVKLNLTKDQTITITTSSTSVDSGSWAFLYVELYASDGTSKKAESGDSPAYGADRSIQWTCDSTGVYYIKLYDYDSQKYDYKLTVTE